MVANKSNQEEEIDLGSLFRSIGNGIKNIFNAIGRLFLNIFHYFILLLIFLKKHLVKLILAIVIGAIVGFFLDVNSPSKYISRLIVKNNFGSSVQLYKQIDYLDELVNKKDTLSLASALQLSSNEASQLMSFSVKVYQPKTNLYKLYDEYMQSTDTFYTSGLEVGDFKKRLSKTDYYYHEVTVISTSKVVFKKISSGIKNLVENSYFKTKKNIKTNELKNELTVLQKNLVQIDSLRSLYKEVAISEAQKESSSSTIEFSQKQFDSNKNDIALFQTSNQILLQIQSLNNQIIINNNVINFVSDFEKVGVLDGKIIHKKYFQFAALFGGLMIFFILLMQLNKYLSNYKKIS